MNKKLSNIKKLITLFKITLGILTLRWQNEDGK